MAVPLTVFGIFCNAEGNRLNLGNFDENGLNCDNWNWDEDANDTLAAFALMVQEILKDVPLYGASLFNSVLLLGVIGNALQPFAEHTSCRSEFL